jgi:hypothetical protein
MDVIFWFIGAWFWWQLKGYGAALMDHALGKVRLLPCVRSTSPPLQVISYLSCSVMAVPHF